MDNTILNRTLDTLLRDESRARCHVAQIRLSNYFNAVQLSDGSVGAAMNYGYRPTKELRATEAILRSRVEGDSLLVAATNTVDDLLLLSLRVSIVSALSMPWLVSRKNFVASESEPPNLMEGVATAVVVGFGGYMDTLARSPEITKLSVADLGYHVRKTEMDSAVGEYRALRPELRMEVSDGADLEDNLANTDLTCITGSALSNGTMEQILGMVRPGSKVVIQGASASIYPLEFFRHGAQLVVTTIKPVNLIEAADCQGLRSIIRSGVPPIYMFELGGWYSGGTRT